VPVECENPILFGIKFWHCWKENPPQKYVNSYFARIFFSQVVSFRSLPFDGNCIIRLTVYLKMKKKKKFLLAVTLNKAFLKAVYDSKGQNCVSCYL